jgi:hypothetical protein
MATNAQPILTVTSYVAEERFGVNSYQSLPPWRRILAVVTIILTNLLPVTQTISLRYILINYNKVHVFWCHDGRRLSSGKGARGGYSSTGWLVRSILPVSPLHSKYLCRKSLTAIF